MNLSFALAIAAFGVTDLAAPALADPAAPAPKIAPAADSGNAADPRTDQRRVCVVDTPTGSHIQRKDCRTRAAWIASFGIDPLAKR